MTIALCLDIPASISKHRMPGKHNVTVVTATAEQTSHTFLLNADMWLQQLHCTQLTDLPEHEASINVA